MAGISHCYNTAASSPTGADIPLNPGATSEGSFSQFSVRNIRTRNELVEFARLRYNVWLAEEYVPPESLPRESEIELDYIDYFSEHFGLFAPNDELVGGGRIVFPECFGEATHVDLINAILDECSDPILIGRLRPRMFALPFDLIDSFPDFSETFKKIFDSNIRIAELSRLVVRKRLRGLGLSKAIIVHMVEYARKRDVKKLVLTCDIAMEKYYERFEFKRYSEIPPGHYGDIKIKSIVMSRSL